MAVNPQALLRSVRSAHLQPHVDAGATAPLPVLYVPAAVRDRAVVRDRLARAGAVVSLAADVPDALQMLGTRRFGMVVVDLASERTALPTVRLIRAQFPTTPVIGVVDPAQPMVASEAIYAGITDLLPWPFEDRDVAALYAAARDGWPIDPTPGRADVGDRLFEYSSSMRVVAETMKAASSRATSTLICGEPGVGRRLIARTLHERDHDYVTRPFVLVDCADAGPLDLERRLFGVVGDRAADAARAGAPERAGRGGAVIAAQGGTLFLVNLVDAPARVQARLARVLRDREVVSADLQEPIVLDVRIVATAGPDVESAVSDGRLRGELFDRVGQVRIDVPPLRRRREDLPALAAHFLRQASEADGSGPRRFSRAALTLLSALPWPGNAHELRAAVTTAVRATRHPIIQLDDVIAHVSLEPASGGPAAANVSLKEARARFERECITATLQRHHGRVGEAAKALGIQRTNLYRKVRQLNVPRALLSHRK